jgi:N-acyl-D-amino-acid deacylase
VAILDILIRNGWVVDGTGNPGMPFDVAIEKDRIAAVGRFPHATATRVIDAQGKIVCPGFVDCHSHSDRSILVNRQALSSLYQGVTTEVAGCCGLGLAPISEAHRQQMEQTLCDVCLPQWSSVGEFLERIAEGTAINIAYQVGHNAVRQAAMSGPLDRQPTEAEMQSMERLVAEALDAGANGLSFGLEFMPGRAADREELRRLCRLAAERARTSGRAYITSWHVRNRDRRFEEAVEEALSVTRETGVGLQISHLSAKPGSSPRAWNRVMEAVRLARAQGQDVQCDMIPYTVGPGSLAAILPNWATQGSVAEVQARLRDPQVRQKLMAESDRYWLLFVYREWDKLTLARCVAHPEWIGMTLRQIGEAAGKDPFDCVYDILADEGEGLGVGVNGTLFSEGDIIEWLADPLFSIASDGMTLPLEGPVARLAHHPNCYGWTPRVIQTYVHELRALRLEEAIRKMTSQPASRYALDRGILRAGMLADVIVFDEQRFRTRSTYRAPQIYAEGMEHVIINGQLALDQGVPTGVLAGRVLRP